MRPSGFFCITSLSVACLASLILSWANPVLAETAAEKHWTKIQRDGTDALDANQYWIAEPLLKQAVIEAGPFGIGDLRLAHSLGELGRLYTIRGRFADAEPLLEEELHVREMGLGNDEGQCIPAMGSLIKFYLNYGTASKADPLANDLLSFVEGRILEASQSSTKVKFKKGAVLEGWAGTAAPTMRNPIIDWAITCDALGNLYRMRGNYELAERMYKAALDIKETVLGKLHLSLANSFDSLGMLAMDKNDFSRAEELFRDALESTERILPPESPEVYSRMDKLAKCMIKAGKRKNAEELYMKAHQMWKAHPSKNGDEARALFALGCLYADEKRYSDAAPTLAHALNLAERFNGPASIALVPYLEKYAYVLYNLGRKPEWEQLRARASTIAGVVQ